MKATTKLLWAALAVAGSVVAVDASAAQGFGRGSGGGASMPRAAGADFGRGGRWNGGSNWNGGGRWHGGGRGHYWGSRYWTPGWGFYYGVPVLWGAYYYGSPYWDDYYYPRDRVIYREREVYPQGAFSGPTTEAPLVEGAPTQGPLYMNYCESSKAYFPKVTSCPEGWKLRTPTD